LTEPQNLDLRRRLLETALVYYESFLDSAPVNDSQQNELIATRAHINTLLSELATLDQLIQLTLNAKLFLLPAVSKELRLSPEQIQTAASVDATLGSEIMQQLVATRNVAPDTRRLALEKLFAENKLLAQLTPAQLQRLRQIALQARGCDAFTDAGVPEELGLNERQLSAIRIEQKERRDRLFDIRVGLSQARRHFSDMSEQENEQMLLTLNNIEGLLTPVQLTKWRQLTGHPVEDLWMLLARLQRSRRFSLPSE
ncbi:MAG: hypothetical protein KDB23_31625, partial [Planctomycetales bacterium]|nr:hypothetical protein [Planctomycetales bacterium]